MDDQVKGNLNKAKGNIEEGVGRATGNQDLENRGVADQAGGAVQNAVGNVREGLHNVGDRIGEALGRQTDHTQQQTEDWKDNQTNNR